MSRRNTHQLHEKRNLGVSIFKTHAAREQVPRMIQFVSIIRDLKRLLAAVSRRQLVRNSGHGRSKLEPIKAAWVVVPQYIVALCFRPSLLKLASSFFPRTDDLGAQIRG